jgi:ribosomal protein L25, Ctc-form
VVSRDLTVDQGSKIKNKRSKVKIMSEKVTVKAVKRENGGKNDTGRLRCAGKVPMVVYGGGEEAVAVAAELRDVAAILRSETGHNTVFTLDIEGVGATDVIFQDRQIDPLKGRLLHADLRRIAKGEKIEVTIPIHLVGEAEGVKNEGGVLEQMLREIKVLCEPTNIPEFVEVDVTNLHVNESLHVGDVKFDKSLEIHESPETVIATIGVVKEETGEQTEAAGESESADKQEAE